MFFRLRFDGWYVRCAIALLIFNRTAKIRESTFAPNPDENIIQMADFQGTYSSEKYLFLEYNSNRGENDYKTGGSVKLKW